MATIRPSMLAPRDAREIARIICCVLKDLGLKAHLEFYPGGLHGRDTILVDHLNNGPSVTIDKVTSHVGCNVQYDGSKLDIWSFAEENWIEVDLADPNSLDRLGRILIKALKPRPKALQK
jgi:hypothetical protein